MGLKNKLDILVQLSYKISFSNYGGLNALKKLNKKELLQIYFNNEKEV